MESSAGMSAGIDNSNPVLASTAAPSVTHTESSPETNNERVFRQSEVNDIVGRAKRDAVERDRKLRVEQPEYAQQKYNDSSKQANHQPESGGSEDQIRKIVADETQRQRQAWEQKNREQMEQQQAKTIVDKFWSKISSGKEKYQDFDKVTGDIEYARFPNTVQILADHLDNSADVLYELGKDRFKMAQLESLSYMSPRDAIIQAQRLAQSIKDNDQASKVRLPNEPLSQMRPSISGTDSGNMSMKDLRAKYRG